MGLFFGPVLASKFGPFSFWPLAPIWPEMGSSEKTGPRLGQFRQVYYLRHLRLLMLSIVFSAFLIYLLPSFIVFKHDPHIIWFDHFRQIQATRPTEQA
jgi:hypothetical protein